MLKLLICDDSPEVRESLGQGKPGREQLEIEVVAEAKMANRRSPWQPPVDRTSS